jgi:hypothetical protein
MPTHLVLLDKTLVISDEAYKLQGSSLCSVLQIPDISSLLDPNIFLSTLSFTKMGRPHMEVNR